MSEEEAVFSRVCSCPLPLLSSRAAVGVHAIRECDNAILLHPEMLPSEWQALMDEEKLPQQTIVSRIIMIREIFLFAVMKKLRFIYYILPP